MFVAGFPAAAFGTNCYVLASGPGQECVVVDPGTDVGPQLDEIIAESGAEHGVGVAIMDRLRKAAGRGGNVND